MRVLALLAALAVPCALLAKPCPRCQEEVADASLFCGTCGQKFHAERRCPDCATPSPEEARFCAQCGRRFGVNAADEQRLVNESIKARGEYLHQLEALSAFYREASLNEKQAKVDAELKGVQARQELLSLKAATVESYAGVLGGKVEPVAEADQLFTQAEQLRKDLDPFRRQANLLKALEIYQALVLKHPQSDKVDECAYYLGQIYASSYLSDLAKAAEYYEKCVLWNPRTDKDARFRAAEAYEKARNGEKAEALYRAAAAEDPLPENREVAKERLKRYARE